MHHESRSVRQRVFLRDRTQKSDRSAGTEMRHCDGEEVNPNGHYARVAGGGVLRRQFAAVENTAFLYAVDADGGVFVSGRGARYFGSRRRSETASR